MPKIAPAVRSRLNAKTKDAAPEIIPPKPAKAMQFTIDKTALRAALLCVATEPSNYGLEAVLLETDKDGARLVSTDGRRLQVVPVAYTCGKNLPDSRAVLSADSIRTALTLGKGRSGDCVLFKIDSGGEYWTAEEGRAGIVPKPVRMNNVEGRVFSTWRDVIPSDTAEYHTYTINPDALAQLAATVGGFRNKDRKTVYRLAVTFGGKELSFGMHTTGYFGNEIESGDFKIHEGLSERIAPPKSENPGSTVYFDPAFLADVVTAYRLMVTKHYRTPLELQLRNPTKPMMWRVGDRVSGLIMPVSIQS